MFIYSQTVIICGIDSCPDPTQDNSKTLDLAKVIELLSDTIDLQKTLEEMISKLQLASNKAD